MLLYCEAVLFAATLSLPSVSDTAMPPFQIRFKTTGTKTIQQRLDNFSRDMLSSRLYKLTQVKSFEKEIVTFLSDENKLLEGLITPLLDTQLRWSHVVRTFNHEVLDLTKKYKKADLTLTFEFEAFSAKYLCLDIINRSHYACILLEGKGDKEICLISANPGLIPLYSTRNR